MSDTEPGDRKLAVETGARKAVYRCLRCESEWVADPFPADCPECGHVYVQWLNFEDRKW